MAILHIIAKQPNPEMLAKLIDRSHANDAYVFMDDGVYILLSKELVAFGARPMFVLADHADERGLNKFKTDRVMPINMADLVNLTTSYASSMSW
jgi:sulfur relay protein TusB/DsrH|tara:strand:- start:192 stop:473 length:282 start_codon:yes stop_codon:yes gene_type:complete